MKGPALPLVLYDLDHPIEPRFVTPKRARLELSHQGTMQLYQHGKLLESHSCTVGASIRIQADIEGRPKREIPVLEQTQLEATAKRLPGAAPAGEAIEPGPAATPEEPPHLRQPRQNHSPSFPPGVRHEFTLLPRGRRGGGRACRFAAESHPDPSSCARQGPGPLRGRPHSRGNPMRILEVQLDDEDLALLEHVRAHLVLNVGAGVTLRGSALAPEEVLRFALHCLADGVGSHHAPTRAQ